MKRPVSEYFSNNADYERIGRRFVHFMIRMNKFVTEFGLDKKVVVLGRPLKQALVDYFVDIERVKTFHKITNINVAKIYAYTAYWLLKRKPIQVIQPFNGCEYVNELFVTAFLASSFSAQKGINNVQKNKNPVFQEFHDLIFYNLKYRTISQQSLELMLEAFFCGYDFSI